MKEKLITGILSISLLGLTLTGCCTGSGDRGDTPSFRAGVQYKAVAQEQLRIPCPNATNHIVQGGYFSGKYYYIAFIANDAPESRVLIGKYDTRGNQVAISEPLDLDHANCLTYNDKKKLFLVTHCQADGENRFATYSFVDPKTLAVTESGELPKPFFAMGYCAARDTYASGEWGGEFLDTWDGELNHLGNFATEQPKTLSQGVWCEKDYTWFVRSSRNGVGAELRLYAWTADNGLDPETAFVIPIQNMEVEPESITIRRGTITCIANNSDCNGAIIYTLTVQPVENE